MNRHSRILELRIEPAPIDRNPVQSLEWIGSEADRGEKEKENEGERARDIGHQLAIARAIRVQRDRRVNRKNQRPEKQRPRLAAPERSDGVDFRQIRTRERRDVLDREIMRQQRRP